MQHEVEVFTIEVEVLHLNFHHVRGRKAVSRFERAFPNARGDEIFQAARG